MEKELREASHSYHHKVDMKKFKNNVYSQLHEPKAKRSFRSSPKWQVAVAIMALAIAIPMTLNFGSASSVWNGINLKYVTTMDYSNSQTVFDGLEGMSYYDFLTTRNTVYSLEEARELANFEIMPLEAPLTWEKMHSFAIFINEGLHYFEFFESAGGEQVIASQNHHWLTDVVNGNEVIDGIPIPRNSEKLELNEDLATVMTIGDSYRLNAYQYRDEAIISFDIQATNRESLDLFYKQVLR
ncbi:hypothetical protein DS745_02885 [Anaerobacillus alkaliphilus]|uniref:Uncharacterized protein n=1 Tax=Anaerobacillus alkaliphilus TaxID=1548597 RepID=A0A4Q0VX72_9BACI|nr:hypothetical protein [Anaerobacillus alkaliphilus]RXJ04347.1 hypothetical protein DS745_02885 [Anaerobacillus alkaliphilus]